MVGNFYLGLLAVAGVASFVLSLPGLTVPALPQTALLALLYAPARRVPVAVTPGGGANLGTAIVVLALMSGTAHGIIVAALGGWFALLLANRSRERVGLMDALSTTLAVAATGFTYSKLGGVAPVSADVVQVVPAAIATGVFAVVAVTLPNLGARLGVPMLATAVWPSVLSNLCLGLIGVCAAYAVAAAPVPMAAAVASAVGVTWLAVRSHEAQTKVEAERSGHVRRRIAAGGALLPSARGHLPTFTQVADAMDRYNQGHGERAMQLASATARGLGLDERAVAVAEMAALLHDIGKLNVPPEVLSKPGPLTADERDLVRHHPNMSAELVSSVVNLADDLVTAVRHHHERFDGVGYPDNLAREDVPIAARIVGVVEAYQAMVTDRPYRRALEHHAAVAELRAEAGTKFDPAVVKAFLAICEPAAPDVAGAGTRRAPYHPPLVLAEV